MMRQRQKRNNNKEAKKKIESILLLLHKCGSYANLHRQSCKFSLTENENEHPQQIRKNLHSTYTVYSHRKKWNEIKIMPTVSSSSFSLSTKNFFRQFFFVIVFRANPSCCAWKTFLQTLKLFLGCYTLLLLFVPLLFHKLYLCEFMSSFFRVWKMKFISFETVKYGRVLMEILSTWTIIME